jgi:YD repeat-containing protein
MWSRRPNGDQRNAHRETGELIRSIDGDGMDVRVDIDALGRPWRRHSGKSSHATAPPPQGRIFVSGFENPGPPVLGLTTDVWVHDTAVNGKGQLHYEERTTQGGDTYRRTMSYDNRGRPSTRTTLIDGGNHVESWTYDALGRPYRETDASGSTLERTWTARGYPYQLRNAATPGEVYHQITAQNARGQITDELRGAATLERTFHPQRGWLTGIKATASATFQNLSYQHDALGNVTQRRDLRAYGVKSSFVASAAA